MVGCLLAWFSKQIHDDKTTHREAQHYDRDESYVRRWLPELKDVPRGAVHTGGPGSFDTSFFVGGRVLLLLVFGWFQTLKCNSTDFCFMFFSRFCYINDYSWLASNAVRFAWLICFLFTQKPNKKHPVGGFALESCKSRKEKNSFFWWVWLAKVQPNIYIKYSPKAILKFPSPSKCFQEL